MNLADIFNSDRVERPDTKPLPKRAKAGKRAQDKTEIDSRPIRTVVVDDSPIVLRSIGWFLERQAGLQLIGTATNGYAAVQRVLELRPDLVLMDLQLPGINGLEATRQIKARSHPPAVILVTADDTPGCRAAARAVGTDAFVDKQHLFSQLRPAIRKLFPGPNRLGKRHANEETVGDW
jgi:DNA-binding NarL/FixJ family response regulator